MLGRIIQQAPLKIAEISTTLRDAIIEHWTEEREVIAPTMKAQDEEWREFWLHASNVHNWCPRMYALMTLHSDKLEGEVVDSDTMWLFEQGHVFHDVLQQKALMSLPREVFRGSWMRLTPDDKASKQAGHLVLHREVAEGTQPFSCDDVVRGWVVKPEGDGWQYVESKVRMHDLRIVVKMDGVLAWPDKPLEVLEIKTEDMMAGESLNPALGGVPRPSHVLQTQVAMLATGLERGRIFYVLKGAKKPKDAFLEHVVERDNAAIAAIESLARRCVGAVEFAEALIDKNTPESDFPAHMSALARLDDCPMKSQGRAKYCAGRDLCFAKPAKKK